MHTKTINYIDTDIVQMYKSMPQEAWVNYEQASDYYKQKKFAQAYTVLSKFTAQEIKTFVYYENGKFYGACLYDPIAITKPILVMLAESARRSKHLTEAQQVLDKYKNIIALLGTKNVFHPYIDILSASLLLIQGAILAKKIKLITAAKLLYKGLHEFKTIDFIAEDIRYDLIKTWSKKLHLPVIIPQVRSIKIPLPK